VIFIFATTEMYKIPSTIISRAQHFLFKRLNKQQLVNMIEEIAKKENIIIANDAIEKIITLVDGSARDCLSILEQLAMFTNNNIKLSDVYKVFGLIDIDNKIDIINLLVSKDTQKIMTLVDQYELQGVNFHQLMYDLNNILIDKLVYLQTNDATILKYTNETHIKKININEQQCIDLLNI
jgi:DNA polymerase-3 subunit gamma/tau